VNLLRLLQRKKRLRFLGLYQTQIGIVYISDALLLTRGVVVGVIDIFSSYICRRVLARHDNSNIEITGAVLQCLRPGAWLNDEVI